MLNTGQLDEAVGFLVKQAAALEPFYHPEALLRNRDDYIALVVTKLKNSLILLVLYSIFPTIVFESAGGSQEYQDTILQFSSGCSQVESGAPMAGADDHIRHEEAITTATGWCTG